MGPPQPRCPDECKALTAPLHLEEAGLPDAAGAGGGAGREEAEIAAEFADRRAGGSPVDRAEELAEAEDVGRVRADDGGLALVGAKPERALELAEEGDPGNVDGLEHDGRRADDLELSVVGVGPQRCAAATRWKGSHT